MRIYNYNKKSFNEAMQGEKLLMFVGVSAKEYHADELLGYFSHMIGRYDNYYLGAGGTKGGVGEVYALSRYKMKIGIVSSLVSDYYDSIANVDILFVVKDTVWAGEKSETSKAIIEHTDVMINIGAGPGGTYEFNEFLKKGKPAIYNPLPYS